MRCPGCKSDVAGEPEFCPQCGFWLKGPGSKQSEAGTGEPPSGVAPPGGVDEFRSHMPPPGAPAGVPPRESVKNPVVAAILSFLIPGVGQIYNGQAAKGVVTLVACLLLWLICVGWVIAIVAAIDAAMIAQKINDGKIVGPWEFF